MSRSTNNWAAPSDLFPLTAPSLTSSLHRPPHVNHCVEDPNQRRAKKNCGWSEVGPTQPILLPSYGFPGVSGPKQKDRSNVWATAAHRHHNTKGWRNHIRLLRSGPPRSVLVDAAPLSCASIRMSTENDRRVSTVRSVSLQY